MWENTDQKKSEFGHFSRNAEYIQEQIIDDVIYSKVINTRKMDDTKLQLQENKQVNHFKRWGEVWY